MMGLALLPMYHISHCTFSLLVYNYLHESSKMSPSKKDMAWLPIKSLSLKEYIPLHESIMMRVNAN